MEIKIIGHYNGKTQNINLFSDFDNFKSFFTKDFNIEEDMEYLQFYILIDESFRIDLIDQKVYNEFVLNNKDKPIEKEEFLALMNNLFNQISSIDRRLLIYTYNNRYIKNNSFNNLLYSFL